ncbi:hypothetical protein [Bacillus sp. FJAT-45066]|uniref:hypothetical protein n=1 Tax=Bacillus sp. FJAT-45066 TaxID=2011010 RepID=UPI000BB935A0|nr:hypothetical protein [Bacillus sp. FJAT-45066]
MELIFIGLIAVVFVFVIIKFFSKKKRYPKLSKENIPSNLGVLTSAPAEKLIKHLETALDKTYVEDVRMRFLDENRKVTEEEFEWRLFELKRYFLLTNILKMTPMFSKDIDAVWHEMIMFTHKYEKFSKAYLGVMLHHYPNVQSKEAAPQERAFFDWVFSNLFEVTAFSWKAWGDFFHGPLSPQLVHEFKTTSNQMLKDKYFNVNEKNEELIDHLIDSLRKQALDSEKDKSNANFVKSNTFGNLTSSSQIMVFYSVYQFENYWLHAKEYLYSRVSNSTSGCSYAVFCGSASSNANNNDADSSSGGDASCSGGGCSS